MDRDYIYHESTISICPDCKKRVDAKIIFKDNKVFLKKYCLKHGEQLELYEEDIEYYKLKKEYEKPSTISKTQTKIRKGCPFDCGLCPSHDQHTCIALIEVTNKCDLKCPVCYAKSGEGSFLSLKKISQILDFLIDSEHGQAEIVQISGGEPTMHPQIIKIIELARSKKIKYIMLNTNGLRIANDEAFTKSLANFKGSFEIYLQFDGFSRKANEQLRGKDVLNLKLKAIKNLQKYKVPMTLVVTLQKGQNDSEIGKIIRFGMKNDCIRGISFQPMAFVGRGKFRNQKDRITLSGTVRRIEKQMPDVFRKGDIVPLPCDPDRVAVTYMFRSGKGFVPLTRNIKIKSYLPMINNTLAFDAESIIRKGSKDFFSYKAMCDCMELIADIKKLLPKDYLKKSKEEKLEYINSNTFRITVTSFVDYYNFDIKSVQKECVHIITPDLKKIPFSIYSMFYRK